jgi:hypothetical protein
VQIARLALIGLLSLAFGAACELVVRPGETRTLSSGESLVGAPGAADTPAHPAVRVEPGGALRVERADLQGGAALVSRTTNPPPGAGIVAVQASVTVSGGSVQGGAVIPTEPVDGGVFLGGSGIEVTRGWLTISGGRIRGGEAPEPFGRGDGALVTESGATIFGGDIDSVEFRQSNGFVFGGRIGSLFVVSRFFVPLPDWPITQVFPGVPPMFPPQPDLPPPPLRASCVELHGGQVTSSIELVTAKLFIFGSSFNLPFGTVPAPKVPFEDVALTGVLEDGTPIDVVVQRDRGVLVLVPTPPLDGIPREILGGQLCPFGLML